MVEVHLVWTKHPTAVLAWHRAHLAEVVAGRILTRSHALDLTLTISSVVGDVDGSLVSVHDQRSIEQMFCYAKTRPREKLTRNATRRSTLSQCAGGLFGGLAAGLGLARGVGRLDHLGQRLVQR